MAHLAVVILVVAEVPVIFNCPICHANLQLVSDNIHEGFCRKCWFWIYVDGRIYHPTVGYMTVNQFDRYMQLKAFW